MTSFFQIVFVSDALLTGSEGDEDEERNLDITEINKGDVHIISREPSSIEVTRPTVYFCHLH